MSAHYIKRCSYCDVVISQCRCPGPRVTRYGVCAECWHKRREQKSDSVDLFDPSTRLLAISDDEQIRRWETEIAEEDERSNAAGEPHPNIGEDFVSAVVLARRYHDIAHRTCKHAETLGHKALLHMARVERLREWQGRAVEAMTFARDILQLTRTSGCDLGECKCATCCLTRLIEETRMQ